MDMRSKWLRGMLIVGMAALLLTVAFLLGRMNAYQLGNEIVRDLSRATHKQIHYQEVEFSFAHTFGLKFHQVEITDTIPGGWALTAGEIDVVPQLIPLLVGALRFKSVFILSPRISMDSDFKLAPMALSPGFGLNRLNLRKGTLLLSNSKVLDHILLDVRNISYNDEALWELKARSSGKKVQSNGRAEISHGDVAAAVGKFNAKEIPAGMFVKNTGLALFESDHLNANLTFDLARDGKWSASGKLDLQSAAGNPPVNLRGKFNGNVGGQISWHDSFIQTGKTIVETSGQRHANGTFRASVRTRGARVEEIFAALHRNVPLHGIFDIDGKIRWQDGKLLSDGKTAWHSMVWDDIQIPEAKADYGGLRIDPDGINSIDWLDLQHGEGSGKLRLESIHVQNGAWSLSAKIIDVKGWWVGAANAISALAGVQPLWKGSGIINGVANVNAGSDLLNVSASWDAGRAAAGFGAFFLKPEIVPASGTVAFEQKGNDRQFVLSDILLGSSGVSILKWHTNAEIQQLTIESMNLDLSESQRLKILIPEGLQALHGSVRGALKSSRKRQKTDLIGWGGWIRTLDGSVELADFGNEIFTLSGPVLIKNGEASSTGLRWQSKNQTALFHGAVSLWPLSGEVHVQDATLDLDQAQLPSWSQRANLHGSFAIVQMKWKGDMWIDSQGTYQLKSGLLHLSDLNARLAGGIVQSPGLNVDFSGQPVLFSGPLSVKNIHLDKLSPLQTDNSLSGTMSARANLKGVVKDWHQWQGEGELSIEQGSFSGVNFLNQIYSLIGITNKSERKDSPFLHLDTRFEFREGAFVFSGFRVRSASLEAKGNGAVQRDNTIAASLDISLPATIGNDGKQPQNVTRIPVHISGIYPKVSMEIVKPSAPPFHP